MKDINQLIVDTATKYLGQEEIRGNRGFKDERFQELMEAAGWQDKQAWCSYFAELVWREAYAQYDSIIGAEVERRFSAGAVKTYNNFKEDSSTWERSVIPVRGALVVWQKHHGGKPHWSGHIGVVVKVKDKTFHAIEGNTNDDGSREGYEVAYKIRKYDFDKVNGLRLIGFIIPKEV